MALDPGLLTRDLAAVYYAAMLRPDPTLAPTPDQAELAAYLSAGRTLARTLLTPRRLTTLRCPAETRQAHPERSSRALATVHDRRLVVIRSRRGRTVFGLRLTRHHIADIPMLQREGHTYLATWCDSCASVHHLPLRSLKKAPQHADSDRRARHTADPSGYPIDPDDPNPSDDPSHIDYTAFAQITGLIRPVPDLLLVTLSWTRAWHWPHTFGLEPPFDRHFDRLIGKNDFRATLPGSQAFANPQWVDPAAYAQKVEAIRKAHSTL